MAQKVSIIFQYYLSKKLIQEFENLHLNTKKNSSIQIGVEPKSQLENFEGKEISDIVIYIQQHKTELIVGGLIVNATYDIFKSGIKFLWTGLCKLPIKKSKHKKDIPQKSITVKFESNDRIAEVAFEGDIDVTQIESVIDKAIDFINSDKLETAFKTPDFIPSREDKPRIRLKFNQDKQIWEPENFGDYRRQMEDMMRWAENNLSS